MSLPVSAFMRREVFAVAPETSLEVAGRLLYGKHITGTPVIDPRGQAVGILSAKDLCDPDRARSDVRGTDTVFRLSDSGRERVEGGKVSSPGRVADVMTPFVVAVGPQTDLRQVMQLMISDDIHRVLVVDSQRQIIGIVSSMDVIRALLKDQ